MAAAPQFKVYDAARRYQAACHEPEAAAVLVSFYGEGSTIRAGHARIVWTEGTDGIASESYDTTAQTICARMDR